jgi:hypothetical protein
MTTDVVLNPDVKELPIGSPSEVAAKENEAEESSFPTKFKVTVVSPGLSARRSKRTSVDCPTSSSMISFPSIEADQSSPASTRT